LRPDKLNTNHRARERSWTVETFVSSSVPEKLAIKISKRLVEVSEDVPKNKRKKRSSSVALNQPERSEVDVPTAHGPSPQKVSRKDDLASKGNPGLSLGKEQEVPVVTERSEEVVSSEGVPSNPLRALLKFLPCTGSNESAKSPAAPSSSLLESREPSVPREGEASSMNNSSTPAVSNPKTTNGSSPVSPPKKTRLRNGNEGRGPARSEGDKKGRGPPRVDAKVKKAAVLKSKRGRKGKKRLCLEKRRRGGAEKDVRPVAAVASEESPVSSLDKTASSEAQGDSRSRVVSAEAVAKEKGID
jgi:hypothetical protein